MSAKELKALKENHEVLREQLRTHTEAIKQCRAQIRLVSNSIKSKNQEIAGLEAKANNLGEMANEFSGVLTLAELETYSNAFTRIAQGQLFESIKSKDTILTEGKNKKDFDQEAKTKKDLKSKKNQIKEPDSTMNYSRVKAEEEELNKEFLSESVSSVDVEFEKVRISFFVSYNDTFETLRQQVASYWALPPDEIFFSDTAPEDGPQALFLLKGEIIKELYVWRLAKLKTGNFLLHLVLRNYTSLKERMEEIFPKDQQTDAINSDTDDPIQRLMGLSRKKDKTPVTVDKQAEFDKRKKWAKVQYLIQWALYLALFLVWTFMISSDKDISKSTWINKRLSQTFLWNFQYDDMEALGLYGAASTSSFFTVTSESKMWEYINNIQALMYSDGDYGIIENYLYSLQYIEIRQLRTKTESCNYEGVFNYTCSKEYNVAFESFEDNLGKEDFSYNVYKSRATSIFVYGDLAYYPNGGYLNSVDIQDDVEWKMNISALQSLKWIDKGTRAVIITMNIYNPSSDIITMIMPYFEISASGIYVQNFKMYSIKRHPYSSSVEAAHAFILIMIILLLILELRQNIRHEEEINTFIFDISSSEPEKLYDQINEYAKLNFFKRLKKPSKDQFFSLITIFSAFSLEIINLSLYFGKFENDIKINTGYTNLFGALQGVAILNDAKTVMILFLACNVMRYIIIWMGEVSKYFSVIVQVFSQVGHYVFLNLLPLLIFSIFMYYFLGPCDSAFNTIEKSFLSTIRIFCGHWPSSRNFQYFTDTGNLVLIYFVFIVWRSLVLSFQAIMFQVGFYKVQLALAKKM